MTWCSTSFYPLWVQQGWWKLSVCEFWREHSSKSVRTTLHILSQRYELNSKLARITHEFFGLIIYRLQQIDGIWWIFFQKNMSIFHPVFLEHSFFASYHSYPLEKIEASCSILETKSGFSRIRRCRNNWTFPSWSPHEPCRLVPVFQGMYGLEGFGWICLYIYIYI